LGMTGREIFLSNAAMNTSDVNFADLEVGGEAVATGDNVEVDESLFEDFDDLDVEDSDLDSD